MEHSAEKTSPSDRRLLPVVCALMLSVLLAALDMSIVGTTLWVVAKDLDPKHGIEHLPWVVTTYTLAVTVTQPLYGKLCDLFGGKRVIMAAIGIFVLGSVLCGAATSMYQLIAFRIIQGLGAGGLLSCAMAILGMIASPRERAKYTGVAAAVTGIATVVGPLAGGFFADRHSFLGITVNWRWAFYLNLPLGVITVIVLIVLLHTPRTRTRPRIDFGGAALVTTGVSALLLITEWGGTKYPWASWQIFALGAAGVVLVAGFLWRQARAAEPILPLRLFRNPVYSVAVPLVFLAGAAMMGLIMYVALYLQFAGGKSATTTGLFLLPMVAGIMLSTSISGQIISAIGRYKIFPILGSACAAVGAGLLGTLEVHISMWLLGAYLMLFGIGIGVLVQVPVMAIQNSVDMVDMGAATSNATFARMLGQSVGSAVYGAVLTQRLSAQLRSSTGGRIKDGQLNVATLQLLPQSVQRTVIEAFVKATHTVFFAGAVSLIVAFVLALFLKELPMRESQPPADIEFKPESSDLPR